MRPGQRWISEAEPELGLGLIESIEGRRVVLRFPARDETRVYAVDGAPLRRARFQPGDRIEDETGRSFAVAEVTEAEDGLLHYHPARGPALPETALAATLGTAQAADRLLAGLTDEDRWFRLRAEAWAVRRNIEGSPVRGFLGGRIELIPHQLYIASEVVDRVAPRVLLADEVGLGKTIEACLVLHRLLRTGRVERALVLVPDALVHQWFVELYRRFHFRFALVDADRCDDETGDPFAEEQLVIASVDWLDREPARATQAVEAGWDLLVVDEAHHLAWTPGAPSPAYAMVEQLAAASEGLLLLTATPEQLGLESHFARLRLLDPARYDDLEQFREEQSHYREAAERARQLQEDGEESLLAELLDRHGPGRVMFRNTRRAVAGFPARLVRPAEVEDKLDWLVELLRASPDEKFLLICEATQQVLRLEAKLRGRIQAKIAVFHEDMTLVQRDRQAAWFAEPDGARLLLCSEIGGEGRNFQFCHHIVLYDLPDHPERVEQRVGRLDRIGQKHDIEIHVPYLAGTREERRFRWLHEGMDAFATPLQGADLLLREFGDPDTEDIDLAALRARRDALQAELEQGRDRLLELHSHVPARSGRIVAAIREHEDGDALRDFLLELFDVFGVHAEELGNRDWLLTATQTYADVFSGFPTEDGLRVTFHRDRALEREDVTFLSWDHPMIDEGLDALHGTERGSTSVVRCEGEPAIYLQAQFVIECPAPRRLQIERFLPSTPVTILVDMSGAEVDPAWPETFAEEQLGPVLQDNAQLRGLAQQLIGTARDLAADRLPPVRKVARKRVRDSLGVELKRLRALAEINANVRPAEIDGLESWIEQALAALDDARLRLDALRLILRQ